MNSEIRQKIDNYRKGAGILKELMEEIPETAWAYKPDADTWSIRQIVHHLADSEVFAYIRLRKLIAENGARLNVFDQYAWAEELKYQEQEPRLALDLYLLLNRLNADLLSRVPDTVWNTHAAIHPERGSITLSDWLNMYESHIHTHIGQIRRTYAQWQGQ